MGLNRLFNQAIKVNLRPPLSMNTLSYPLCVRVVAHLEQSMSYRNENIQPACNTFVLVIKHYDSSRFVLQTTHLRSFVIVTPELKMLVIAIVYF